jgi:hypothetical protein
MSSNSPTNDWFVSAILKDGTVSQCLLEVEGELGRKQKFIAMLRERIAERSPSKIDAISDITGRVLTLENTLKFRLTILSPSRRGAWFRESASTSVGPFGGALLTEPIFSNFDEKNSTWVRAGLSSCWIKRSLIGYPLRATESCLWKILLTLNFELHVMGDLDPWPRLEKLPEGLPPELDSRSLRAFLNNVKAEYLGVRRRLDDCYQSLFEASSRFWAVSSQKAQPMDVYAEEQDIYDGHRVAEKLRQEFRSRRSSPTINRPVTKSSQDIEALSFMGFDEFPDTEMLRQRYHALAMTMHPDREGGNEARFKLLAKSYKHLMRQCAR